MDSRSELIYMGLEQLQRHREAERAMDDALSFLYKARFRIDNNHQFANEIKEATDVVSRVLNTIRNENRKAQRELEQYASELDNLAWWDGYTAAESDHSKDNPTTSQTD